MEPLKQSARSKSLRVLFLCTGNSARSQIAEAILSRKSGGRFTVGSAGSQPAARVHPLTIDVLRKFGIDWAGKVTKGIDAVLPEPWDLVITVCDQARETRPLFPGLPAVAQWGIPDPAAVTGSEATREQAFLDTVHYLTRRIDLLLVLPIEKLEKLALETRVRAIAEEVPPTPPSVPLPPPAR